MATIVFTDGSASITTTEYYLASASTTKVDQTNDCDLQVVLDCSALVAGDQFRIRIYEKVNGGTQAVLHESYTPVAPVGGLIYLPKITVGDGWEVSLKKTAGANATIAWSLRQWNPDAANAVNVSSFTANAITAAAINAAALTLAKFGAGAIDSTILAANAIGASQIAAAAITAAKFATDAIDANALKTDAVTEINAAIIALLPTALVGGRMNSSVGAMAAGVVTAAAVATDAIDADALAADAIAEIQSGLALAATALSSAQWTNARAGYQDNISAGAVALASALATAQTAISDIQTDVDELQTSVAAIPTAPALASALATAQTAITDIQTDVDELQTTAATLATSSALSTAQTAITAIKAKTDNLPAAPADETLIILATNALATSIAAVQADTDDIQTRIPATLVGGRIDASVGAMAANTVTASAIAADAIGASELAADAVTEIQSGLSTASALAAVATSIAALPTAVAIRDAILTYALRSGRTIRGLLRRIDALNSGRVTGLLSALVKVYQPGGVTLEYQAVQNQAGGTRDEVDCTTSETP